MKKKLLILFLSVISTVWLAVGLSACGGTGGTGGTGGGSSGGTQHEHALAHYSAVEATETEDGHKEYWYCSGCGKYFADSNAATEISADSIIIEATGETGGSSSSEGSESSGGSSSSEGSDGSDSPSGTEGSESSGGSSSEGSSGSGGSSDSESSGESGGSSGSESSGGSSSSEGSSSTEDSSGGEAGLTETLSYCLNSDNSSYTVTGIGTVTASTVEIPATYNSLPVTAIDSNAFANGRNIEVIIIGSNVTSVGSAAFKNCTAVYSVTFQSDSISIGNNAFRGCTSLYSITFGSGETTIGINAFYGCTALTSLHILSSVTTIQDNAFEDCENLTEVVITGNAQLGAGAFRGCTLISDVTLSEEIIGNLSQILSSAFLNSPLVTDVKTESNTYHAHTLTYVDASAVTCTTSGNIGYWYCAACDRYFSDESGTTETSQLNTVISATGHALIHVEAVAATCTTDGNTEYWYCSTCGNYFSDESCTEEIGLSDTVIEAKDHNWDGGEITTQPTCTEEGVKTYTCTACGDTYTETIAAIGHTQGDGVTENEVEATCTEAGSYDTVIYCTECGEELSSVTTTIPATGHTWNDGEITTEPTCTKEGVKTYTCTECGETYTESIAANGHSWDDGEVTFEPTCTEEGVKTYTCTACGDTYTETIAKTAHTEGESVIENEVAATCTEAGSYDIVIYCTECGAELSRVTTTIPAAGHTQGEVLIENVVAATCTESGSYDTVIYCTECGAELSRVTTTIPAVGHTQGEAVTENEIEATCTTEGSYDTVIYCTVCNEEISRVTTTIPATGHKWNDGEVTTEPTCTKEGVKTYTCTECGETYTEAVAATGHSYTNYACNGDATCTTDGTKTATCDNGCGTQDTVTAEGTKTGHTYDTSNIEWTWDGYSSATAKFTCKIGDDTQTVDAAITNAVTTTATCTAAGVRTYTATVIFNGTNYTDIQTEVIPATGHSYEGVVTAPTCTEQGYTTYTCSVCGNTYISDYTEATGHDYYAYEWTWSSDYSTVTATLKCTSGDDTQTLTATITSKITIAATCTETGVKTYTATVTIDGENYTDTKTEVIPATGHSFKNEICTVCGYEDGTSVGLEYTLSDDEKYYTVSGIGTCADTEIIIPSTYKFLPVTEIGENAFKSKTQITSVTIANSVTFIGSYAFYSCSSLASLTIGSGVTSIASRAFYGCTALTEINFNATAMDDLSSSNYVFYLAGQSSDGIAVTIGAEVTKIPDYLFCPLFNGTNIKSIVFENGCKCTSIGDYAFSGCASLTSVTIPDSVKTIGSYAFDLCTALTDITIPDGVTSIGDYAFRDCTSLVNITIPNSVTSIGSSAFYECFSLTSVVIGTGVTSIGTEAFRYCYKLVEVYNLSTLSLTIGTTANGYAACYAKAVYTSENEESELFTRNNYLFFGYGTTYYLLGYAGNDTELTLPELYVGEVSIQYSIYQYAFYKNTNLISITIPYRVTSIGNDAFNGCTSLTSVYYTGTASQWANIEFGNTYANPLNNGGKLYLDGELAENITLENITSVNTYAFYGCTSLTSVTIGDGVTSIGESAFYNCVNLTNVTIGDGITFIGKNAFYNSGYYNGEANWEDGVLYIGAYLIKADASLSGSYTIKSGTEYIAEYAFYNSALLTEIIIPDSVTSVGAYAFYACSCLEYLTIGNGVKTIGNYAFEYCRALVEINFNATEMDDLSSYNYVFFEAGKNSDGITVNVGAEVTKIPAHLFHPYTTSSVPNIISVVFEEDSVCTNIGQYAFYYCTALTSVTFKGSSQLQTIASYAFAYCKSLTSVTFEGSSQLQTIVSDAFYGCTSLTTINIPDSIKSIDQYAFRNCTALTYYTYENGYYLGNASNNYVVLYKVIDTTASSFTINNNTKLIFYNAFDGCSSLESVSICDLDTWCNIIFSNKYSNPMYIASYLYLNGTNIEGAITLSENVTVIPYGTFKNSSITSISIPDNVTAISDYAFSGCTSLTSVTIGNSVTSIGESAFYDCTALASVTMGSGVTTIGKSAFSGCIALESITIPESMVTIGTSAFNSCTSLTSVYYAGTASQWASIAFDAASANPLYHGGKLNLNGELADDITLENITTINTYAFYGCTSLTSVTIGDSVTTISEYAFYNCTNLATLTIGSGVTSIGNYAFYNCTALTAINFNATAMEDLTSTNFIFYCAGQSGAGITVTIGTNVTTIPAYLFSPTTNSSYAPNIISVVFKDGSVCESIGSYAFYGCTKLASITLPDCITSIGQAAFYNTAYYNDSSKWTDYVLYINTYLIEANTDIADGYTITDDTTVIADYAFYNCSGLTSITIPDSVTNIGNNAFYGCTALESITLPFIGDIGDGTSDYTYLGYLFGASSYDENSTCVPSSLTTVVITSGTDIPSYAFYNCASIINITIPDTVTEIGSYAFYGCTALESITLPNKVTYIGSGAFFGCKLLESVNIPDSVTSIGDYAFCDCDSLTKITIGNGVTSIGNYAFYDCNLLSSITIGSGVTSIGYYAFHGCDTLESITIPNNVTYIGNGAFSSCSSLKSITIPDSITSIADYTFSHCTSLTSVTIGSNVTSIGGYAFYYCTSLTSVMFEITGGWYLSTSPSAESGTEVNVADASANATYITDTYYNYYWYRSESEDS